MTDPKVKPWGVRCTCNYLSGSTFLLDVPALPAFLLDDDAGRVRGAGLDGGRWT